MLIMAGDARLIVRAFVRGHSNARRERDHAPVVITDPALLLERFAVLPAAQPLLAPLDGWLEDIYLVGGAVRDLMLGGQPVDLDLMLPGAVDAVAGRLGGELLRHDRFGTAGGELDGHRYDLARSRQETYPRPGALPEVSPADVEADLARRDFTVNAIALAVLGPHRGRLIAVESAIQDLERGLLRVLHERSFRDDPTRLLRLARYQARLGFAVEPYTLELVRAALAGHAFASPSGGRIGAELRLLAAEPDPVTAFAALRELGIDGAVASGFGLADPKAVRRGLELLPPDGSRAGLVLGAAMAGLHAAERASLLNRLAFPAHERDRILDAAAASELARRLRRVASASETAVTVGAHGPEAVALAGGLGPEAAARRWLDELREARLEITGADLVAAGVAPGPGLGRGLAAALSARLDGEAEDRETQLEVAVRVAREGSD